MKKVLLLGAATLAIVFASCSNDEMSESTSNSSAQRALSFSTYSEKTRAGVDTLADANLTAFRVMGYYTGANDIDAEHFIPNYMYNQDVTRLAVDDSWQYNPTKYWPQVGDKLSFFAISGDNISWLTGMSSSGLPIFGLTSNDGLTSDCVGAASVNNVSKATGSNNAVSLTFKHLTSRIKIQAAASSSLPSGYKVTVTDLKLKTKVGVDNIYSNYTESSFDKNGTCTIIPNYNLNEVSLTGYLSDEAVTVGENMKNIFGNGYAFLIPYGILGTANDGDAILEVEYTLQQEPGTTPLTKKTISYNIPKNFLAQGKAYCLDMTVDGGDKVQFATSVEYWDTEAEQALPATMLWYNNGDGRYNLSDFTEAKAFPTGFGTLNDCKSCYADAINAFAGFITNGIGFGYKRYVSIEGKDIPMPVITIDPATFPCIKTGSKLIIYFDNDVPKVFNTKTAYTEVISETATPYESSSITNRKSETLNTNNVQKIEIPQITDWADKLLTLQINVEPSDDSMGRIIGIGVK
nr:fimbrillin family protein [Prevotella sp.]